METFQLYWEGPFKVLELRKALPIKSAPDWMTWMGIYVFLDHDFILYVGSATKEHGFPLRKRIRDHLNWQSVFSGILKDNGINIDMLQLIVFSNYNDKLSYNDILKIERILIHRRDPPGNFSDDFEIVNSGSFMPFPEKIQSRFSHTNTTKKVT